MLANMFRDVAEGGRTLPGQFPTAATQGAGAARSRQPDAGGTLGAYRAVDRAAAKFEAWADATHSLFLDTGRWQAHDAVDGFLAAR